MNKSWIMGAAFIALTVIGANAQQASPAKVRKEAAVVNAKTAMGEDKIDFEVLRDRKEAHKLNGDKSAVRTDRKEIRKGDRKLLKDRVKKDVAKVNKAL